MDEEKEVKILYTNWRGETNIRKIMPKEIVFMSNEWHKEKQWCVIAYDLDKQADRTFACKDIKCWFL
ncbi:MAG: WYL domain-containing protein [Nanoarchaeota archaeon]|nr:WYL domain-containing protein [Nanoarchaeota archaeon]MBU1977418.1 WYL domain-containing protein [Nanoarchaeota archaeon]